MADGLADAAAALSLDAAPRTPEEAHALSSAACARYLASAPAPLDHLTCHKFRTALGVVSQARQASGSQQPRRVALLPTGVCTPVTEWGPEDAPVIVLLHDVASSSEAWHTIAGRLGMMFRVVAPDLRGHGVCSWEPEMAAEHYPADVVAKEAAESGAIVASSAAEAAAVASAAAAKGAPKYARDFSLKTMVRDVLHLAVCMGLNGKDEFDGSVSKPWYICGLGMGAAVASAFAAAHPERVSALVCLDYDHAWPAARLNYFPYQALGPVPLGELARLIDAHWAHGGTLDHMARRFTDGCVAPSLEATRFGLDEHFLLRGHDAASGERALKLAGRRCHVLLMHAYEKGWAPGRAAEIRDALRDAGLPSVEAGSAPAEMASGVVTDPDMAVLKLLVEFFVKVAEAGPLAPAAADSAAPLPDEAAAAADDLTEPLKELVDAGGDVAALVALVSAGDPTALTVALKGLGFKGMKKRKELEKELAALAAA